MTEREKTQPIQPATWEDFDEAMDYLAKKIWEEEKKRKKRFIGIHGIKRGGYCPAVALSHRLGIPMTDIFFQPDIILVDDISDKGKTMNFHMKNNPYKNSVLTATWLKRVGTEFKPDVCFGEIKSNAWIEFPWETWHNKEAK